MNKKAAVETAANIINRKRKRQHKYISYLHSFKGVKSYFFLM